MSSLLVGHTVQKVDTGGDVLAKLVLLILADYANSEGKAWPSLDTLAKQTGRSLASVKRARAKLVDLGLIEISDDQGYTLKYRGDQRPQGVRHPAHGRHARTPRPTRQKARRARSPREKPGLHRRRLTSEPPFRQRRLTHERHDGSPMHRTTAHP